VKSVLMLRALGLGDFLTGVPAMRAVRRTFPSHRIVLATTSGVAPLALATGVADEVTLTTPLGKVDPAFRNCDVAVNLHGKGPQSHWVLQALDPQRMIAFRNVEAAFDGPMWRADEHEVRRWCRMLTESGVPADVSDLYIEAPATELPFDVADNTTLLHPGAASPSRRWPPDRWAQAAHHELAAGRGVLLTGSIDERLVCERIQIDAGLDAHCVVAGRTDALQLATLVSRAGRVVVGDTGVAHLATALRIPSVVLFGPVSPTLWGPPPDSTINIALWAGDHGDPHGRELDGGLSKITVDHVIRALDALPELALPEQVKSQRVGAMS
jgi:ADP-heptose:LPS heptosyltransferase